MSSFRRVMDVLLAALDLAPADRSRYIADVCGTDVELRSRVQSLLGQESSLPGLLATGEPDGILGVLEGMDIAASAGSRIDSYEIIRKIGEGGMGVVFLARQTEPIRREVALKLIRPGMDSGRIIARFAAERQSLALMDHWNIARLHHAGATESGRPYFVMEFVDGERITNYADRRRLSIAERLRLVVPVCHAIHHAHQKGVVHRDIKPSNILVAEGADGPVPKIIDFGVARVVGPDCEGGTLTNVGDIVGTPEYMSPEQADRANTDVDAATDIYSLGVLLYELVTGRVPFGRNPPGPSSIEPLLRKIREETPRPPSEVVRGKEEVARDRRTSLPGLQRELRAELDWIIGRALEKERGRRYASAAALAEDLERYLRDEAVLARPPSTIYQLRKAVRRHRAAFGIMVTLLVFVLLAATVMGFLWQEQRQARLRSDRVRSYLTKVLGSTTSRIVLDEAGRHVDRELGDDASVRAEVQAMLGRAYRNLDLFDESAGLLDAALASPVEATTESRLERAAVLADLGSVRAAQERYADAEACYEESARERATILGDRHSVTTRTRLALANVVLARGDTNRAGDLFRRLGTDGLDPDDRFHVALSLARLAEVCDARHEVAAADSLFRASVERMTALSFREHGDVRETIRSWAQMHADHGNLDRAIEILAEAVELQRRATGEGDAYALYLSRLGRWRADAGQDSAAEADLRRALAIQKESVQSGLNRIPTEWSLALLLFRQARTQEAEARLRWCLEEAWKHVDRAPALPGRIEADLGAFLIVQERFPDAEALLLGADRRLGEGVSSESPERRTIRERIVDLYEAWGRPEAADRYRPGP